MLRLRLGTTFPRYTSHGTIRYLITQARHLDENSQRDCEGTSTSTTFPRPAGLATPRQVCDILRPSCVWLYPIFKICYFIWTAHAISGWICRWSRECEESVICGVCTNYPTLSRNIYLKYLFEAFSIIIIASVRTWFHQTWVLRQKSLLQVYISILALVFVLNCLIFSECPATSVSCLFVAAICNEKTTLAPPVWEE